MPRVLLLVLLVGLSACGARARHSSALDFNTPATYQLGHQRALLQDASAALCTQLANYTVTFGRTHVGDDIPNTCNRNLTTEQLADECTKECTCSAFTTDGCLKVARGDPQRVDNVTQFGQWFCMYQVLDMELFKPSYCDNSRRCPDIPGFSIERKSGMRPSQFKLDDTCYPGLTLEQLADKCWGDCACKAFGEDRCLRSRRGSTKPIAYIDLCYYEVTPNRPKCTCRNLPGYVAHKGVDHEGGDIEGSCSRELSIPETAADCDQRCCYAFHERTCLKSDPSAGNVSTLLPKVFQDIAQRTEDDFCYYTRNSAPVCLGPAGGGLNAAGSSLSGGAIAGIVVGAVAVAALLALLALLTVWRRRLRRREDDQFSTMGASKTWVMTPGGPVRALDVPGVHHGEAFMRATAYAYNWVTLSPEERGAMEAVEAGVNDARLDSHMDTCSDLPGPAVQLSAAELAEHVQLNRNGLLGRGGAAIVFECTWPSRFGPKAVLAAKVLKEGYDAQADLLQSFTYEAAVLSSLYPPHDNVVRLYGYCLEPPTVCLIMELLPRSLKDVLHPPAPLPPTTSTGGVSLHVTTDTELVKAGAAPLKTATRGDGASAYATCPTPASTAQPGDDDTRAATDVRTSPGKSYHTALSGMVSAVANKLPALVSPFAMQPTPQPLTHSTASSVTHTATTGPSVPEVGLDSGGPSAGSTAPTVSPLSAGYVPEGLRRGPSFASLSSAMQRRLTMLEVVQLSTDIAAALKFLHERPLAVSTSLLAGAVGVGAYSEQDEDTHHTSDMAALPALLSVIESPGSAAKSDGHMGRELLSLKSGRSTHIVHRDLKPANILLNSRGTAKLSDFGLARPQQRTTLVTEHLGAGTLAYMSPEQLAGKVIGNIATERVDIYAAAIMMWEMMSGSLPWEHVPQSTVVTMVLRGRRPDLPIPKLSPDEDRGAALQAMASSPAGLDVCPEYNAIIRAAWQQREHRRPSAATLHELLTALLSLMRGQAGGSEVFARHNLCIGMPGMSMSLLGSTSLPETFQPDDVHPAPEATEEVGEGSSDDVAAADDARTGSAR